MMSQKEIEEQMRKLAKTRDRVEQEAILRAINASKACAEGVGSYCQQEPRR